jgi:hypothetical protein
MLHLESDWTSLLGTRRPAQTEGYDGDFHGEFVVRKGHSTNSCKYLAGNALISGNKTFK